MKILLAVGIFVLAGLCEIGGGYMVWLWLRDGKSWWVGLLGGIVLMAYGVVATLQTENFGRVYAAYGGIFIAMAILWGWKVGWGYSRQVRPNWRAYSIIGYGNHHVCTTLIMPTINC